MSRYDGLIIPRSYSEYINKTDAATLLQALQQSGVMDAAPTSGSNHPAKSGGIATALAGKQATLTFDDAPTQNSNNPVKSSGIYTEIRGIKSLRIAYNAPQEYKVGTWGSFIVLANIDGAGNSAFIMTITNSYLYVQSLVSITMSGFFAPTVENNIVKVGNSAHMLKISIANDTLTLEKTTSAYAHVTIIRGDNVI